MVDGERVLARLARLPPLLERLDGIRSAGLDAYLAEPGRRLEAERALQLALQICLDVGAQLVAELDVAPAETYRQVFARLAEASVIDAALAARLEDAASMRNLLVHGDADLDHRLVWESLGGTADLRAFAAAAAGVAGGG